MQYTSKKLTEEFNKATVTKDDMFEIELMSTTGSESRWGEPNIIGDAAILAGQVYPRPVKDKGTPTGQTSQTFFFKAKQAGEVVITAERKTRGGNAPDKSLSFKVSVLPSKG